MANKTWTATDLNMGVLRLKRDDVEGTLSIMEGYSYADENGDTIEDLPKKTISTTVAYADLPDTVITGLLTVFEYIYGQALIEEGME
jgi:hypothetical protein